MKKTKKWTQKKKLQNLKKLNERLEIIKVQKEELERFLESKNRLLNNAEVWMEKQTRRFQMLEQEAFELSKESKSLKEEAIKNSNTIVFQTHGGMQNS